MTARMSIAGRAPVGAGEERSSLLRIAVPSFGGHGAATEAGEGRTRVSREELLRIFGMDLRRTFAREARAETPSSTPVSAESLPAELRPVPRTHPALTDRERRDREISARIRQALYPQKAQPLWRQGAGRA